MLLAKKLDVEPNFGINLEHIDFFIFAILINWAITYTLKCSWKCRSAYFGVVTWDRFNLLFVIAIVCPWLLFSTHGQAKLYHTSLPVFVNHKKWRLILKVIDYDNIIAVSYLFGWFLFATHLV